MIAVIDDEEQVRKALVRLLQANGYSTRAFATGKQFLQACEIWRPDCVLLDLSMPGLSGADVQRALHRANIKLPLVVVSAYDDPIVRQDCMSQGAVECLRKPPDQHALLSALHLAIGARRPSWTLGA